MQFVLMFGGEARSGFAITPDAVEVFTTPADQAERVGATATALGKMVESFTLLEDRGIFDDRARAVTAETVATLTKTILGEVRDSPVVKDEMATLVYVGQDAAVLVTPDGTAQALPVTARHDVGNALEAMLRSSASFAAAARG